MSIYDDDIICYDNNKMINNIKRIMNERNINQTKLSKKAGVSQPRISAILNGSSGNCFTLQQVVAIASYFKMSIDDLLDYRPPKEEPQEITLADVYKSLFTLNRMIELRINEIDTYQIDHNSDDEPRMITTTGIYFDNKAISEMLRQWGELKNFRTDDKILKNDILNSFEQSRIKNSTDRKFRWNFRNRKEQGRYLAEKIISDWEKGKDGSGFEIFQDDNFDILSEYIKFGYARNEFCQEDASYLERYIRIYDNVLKDIDSELPSN